MNILIILGEKLLATGKMSSILINRLNKGNELHKKNLYDKIIVAGGLVEKKALHSESHKMKQYLINKFSIDNKKIIKEDISTTTIENATECHKIIKQLKDVNMITIVSSSFHIKRVQVIFTETFKTTRYNINYESSNNGMHEKELNKRLINEKKYLYKYIESIKQ
jgi:uncharacterized SAM-binding protein YcdF (DUF218 family)